MKPFLIFIIVILCILVFIFLILLLTNYLFNRHLNKRMDGDIRFKFQSIRDYPDLVKKDISIFSTTKDKLNGAIFSYKDKKYKGVIIFFHGLYCGYLNYLNLIEYFASKDYIVVAFDNLATMSSAGTSMRALGQFDKDVKQIVDYVVHNKELNIYPIYSVGHSMGAHLAMSSIIIDDIHIKKAVALSPYNSIVDVNYTYKKESILFAPFIYLLNGFRFGFTNYYKVTDAIKYSAADMLIMCGENDPLVNKKYSYDKYIKAKVDNDITNIDIRLLKDRKHFLYLSKEAEDYYTKNVSWPRTSPIDFKNLDYKLINELDYNLLDDVIAFLEK